MTEDEKKALKDYLTVTEDKRKLSELSFDELTVHFRICSLLQLIKANITLYIDDPDELNDLSPLTECLDLIDATVKKG